MSTRAATRTSTFSPSSYTHLHLLPQQLHKHALALRLVIQHLKRDAELQVGRVRGVALVRSHRGDAIVMGGQLP